MFSDINEVQEFVNVSHNLDIELLLPYEDTALQKLYQFIPKELFDQIKTRNEDAYKHMQRAAANYMVVYAIPFLKIKLSNIGGSNYDDNKLKKADWWDIRDYGLSAVKIADKALSSAIKILEQTSFQPQLTLPDGAGIFKHPEDMEKIYPIGKSWDVLLQLQSTIETVYSLYISPKIGSCQTGNILRNDTARNYLQSIVGCYTISNAALESALTFTRNGIVVEWAELPWKKSQILSENELEKVIELYEKRGKQYMDMFLEFLRTSDAFKCYKNTEVKGRKTIKKKSGLYL